MENIYDDLELSTQLLIAEAMSRNVRVEILDGGDNFIRLSRGMKIEYVKQATRTSADTYIAPLIMENKAVTKMLLAERGIRVPRGAVFNEIEGAIAAFQTFFKGDIVIKPNLTNFGKGVVILKKGFSFDEYRRAFEGAFEYDETAIVEEFIDGKEYRFLVVAGEVMAVLHRIAANVVGDGTLTVGELIDEKNTDPHRGTGYRKPLEKIKAGAEEESFLKAQGKDFGYIPVKGEQVFLRKNSNISTGGDSIDCTDDIPEAYKKIAVDAAQAVGAMICGADIIIRDLGAPPDVNNYAVIELNFNPAIHIHAYPYRGTARHAEKRILDLLGFTEESHAEN